MAAQHTPEQAADLVRRLKRRCPNQQGNHHAKTNAIAHPCFANGGFSVSRQSFANRCSLRQPSPSRTINAATRSGLAPSGAGWRIVENAGNDCARARRCGALYSGCRQHAHGVCGDRRNHGRRGRHNSVLPARCRHPPRVYRLHLVSAVSMAHAHQHRLQIPAACARL